MAVWRFEAIGTTWEIETEGDLAQGPRSAITAVIDAFDRTWSRFREDSLVAALAHAGGTIAAPTDAVAMLDLYRDLSAATGGAVNPLIGDSLTALGYDASHSLTAGTPQPAPAAWQDVLRWSATEMTLATPALIDVGAVGKGRLVDLVLAALEDVPGDIVVDGSGDLRVRGRAARIALEHPYDASKAVGVVSIRDRALCASAINRRAWGDGLHHVLDARTGMPVRTWAATWAIADDAMTADAAATALFFDGGPQFAAAHGVEWVRMSTEGRVQRSPGCPAELFTRRSGTAERASGGENAEELRS